MTLSRYTELIRCLPHLDQAFTTKRTNWPSDTNTNPVFVKFCDQNFVTEDFKLSRADLFEVCKHSFHKAIFSIIFWGYPRNMRGNNFDSILKALPQIEDALAIPKDLSAEDFKSVCIKLKNTGVGLSTLSKFLYFFQFKLGGRRCLILDKRIMDVINYKDGFKELKDLSLKDGINENNKYRKYVVYLQLMEDLSSRNGYESDQLEFFLFSMGMNLKPSYEPTTLRNSFT